MMGHVSAKQSRIYLFAYASCDSTQPWFGFGVGCVLKLFLGGGFCIDLLSVGVDHSRWCLDRGRRRACCVFSSHHAMCHDGI